MPNNDSSGLILVLTTEESTEKAEHLAKYLIEHKLACCISFYNVRSYYSWEGKLELNQEVQLLIKTTSYALSELLDAIRSLHSYDLPELIYWNVSSSREYGEWINQFINGS